MSTKLVELNEPAQQNISVGTDDMLFQPVMMQALEHFALQMSKGKSTVPAHLQGAPADCMAVAMQAAQWRMNPFAVAQKTHLVNGTLGYEAQLVNAVVSSSRAIVGRFKYEWEGDTKCRVGAVIAGEAAITWGQWVDAAKQTTKNSPLWKTDPAQQLAYLAVKKWARLYTPDVILGVYTPDELEAVERDMGPAQVVQDAPTVTRTQSVKDKVKSKQAAAQPAQDVDMETGEVIEAPSPWTYDDLMRDLAECKDAESLALLQDAGRSIYKTLTKTQQDTLAGAIKAVEFEVSGGGDGA
jgi:hypothetical protein